MQQHRPTRVDLYRCFDCGELNDDYMVQNEIWASARRPGDKTKHMFLCLSCLGKRIGRRVTINDLAPVPINNALRYIALSTRAECTAYALSRGRDRA